MDEVVDRRAAAVEADLGRVNRPKDLFLPA
jgi:hypothetical protein